MNTLPIMEKLLDLPDSAKACLPDSAKACLPDSAKACLPDRQVEWKALGDIGVFIRGNGLQKKDFVESGFPAIHYGQIYTKFGLSADKTFTFVEPALAARLRKAQKNDLLLATTSENDEDVVKPLAWFGEEVAISGDMMLFRHSQHAMYLAYYFKSDAFQEQKRKFITGAKVRRVSSSDLAKIVIPIPPLNVQAEIVRILDAFTAYTTELTTELTARKKQYNHYRDQLLSFSDTEACLPNRQVEWKTLGEVAQYSKTRINAAKVNSTNYVGVDNLLQNREGKKLSNYVPTEGNLTEFLPNDTLIGNIRPYLKKIWFSDCVGGTNGDVLVIRPFYEELDAKYLYQVLADDKFFDYNMQHAKGAKMPRGNKDKIMEYPIPIPSLKEQARIVAILDKFDALTASISEGLPREIELRQKQYEYYRDRLLSFPKPASDAAA